MKFGNFLPKFAFRQKGLKIRIVGFDFYYHSADFTLWIQKPECL